jgi:Spy/CpxP family protein refolding chaperone
VIAPTLRAGLVIGALVIASAIAGAAIDRSVLALRKPTSPRAEGGRRSFQEQEDHRRTEMLDRMTRELSLTAPQRAGLDSIFQRTDSSLRAIRRETQPRIQQVFERSKAEVDARLDPAQREKFAKMRPPGRPSRDGYRGGGPGGGRGMRGDSVRQ